MDKRRYLQYIVRRGDTYEYLAAKFDISEQKLRGINRSITLNEGAQICVPAICDKGEHHRIEKDETLLCIAQQNGLLLQDLLFANPWLNPADKIEGLIILIPKAEKNRAYKYYFVGENEGLFDVLRKFQMDVTTFALLNPKADLLGIKPGQRVNIRPPCHRGGRWHTISAGENIPSIAKNYRISISELLSANENLRPADFVAGKKVLIP